MASRVVFAKRVDHPGTKASPFLRPALRKVGIPILKRQIGRVFAATRGKVRSARVKRLDLAVRMAASATQVAAVRKVLVRTGRLKASINVRRRGPMHYTVGTNVVYAKFIEFGTRRHPIVAKKAKALRFVLKGGKTTV